MSHLADGTLHYQMDTVTGYRAEGEVKVTAAQWAQIQRILVSPPAPSNLLPKKAMAAAQKEDLLDWVTSCERFYHIDNTPSHCLHGHLLPGAAQASRDCLVDYVEELLAAAEGQVPEGASQTAHEPDIRVDELTMLVGRLVRALRKAAPDHALPGEVLGYLRRKGLQPSPLREAQPVQGSQGAEND